MTALWNLANFQRPVHRFKQQTFDDEVLYFNIGIEYWTFNSAETKDHRYVTTNTRATKKNNIFNPRIMPKQ